MLKLDMYPELMKNREIKRLRWRVEVIRQILSPEEEVNSDLLDVSSRGGTASSPRNTLKWLGPQLRIASLGPMVARPEADVDSKDPSVVGHE